MVIIIIAALLTMATIIVAVVTGADLVRQKERLDKLESWRETLLDELNEVADRRKVVDGNLEMAEKAMQEKLGLLAEIKLEIEEQGKGREINQAKALGLRESGSRHGG
jgi:biopolymer transport protein ExbB/TolQ